jgi:hypothetical protein
MHRHTPKVETPLFASIPLRPENNGHWESQKPTLGRLYLDLNLPVDDVIAIMKTHHQFVAR